MTRKRFGQHFLHERSVVDRILAAVAARPDDSVVEIGPGKGALTWPLLESVDCLTAIEIDRDLIDYWQNRAKTHEGFKLVAADALRVDYAQLAEDLGGPIRLVGNLPYNISTPLLFRLLTHPEAIRDMHFMLQKEVVDRMTATPGSRTYGRLSVAVAARARTSHLFDVSPGCFSPPPQVMSSVVRIEPEQPDFTIDDDRAFNHVLTAAFNQRRKTLRNALKTLVDANEIATCGIDPSLRPEQLHARDFAHIANRLAVRQHP